MILFCAENETKGFIFYSFRFLSFSAVKHFPQLNVFLPRAMLQKWFLSLGSEPTFIKIEGSTFTMESVNTERQIPLKPFSFSAENVSAKRTLGVFLDVSQVKHNQ